MNNIGERIKSRRLELDMTQDELAKKAGYKSRSSINKIELTRDLPLNKVSLIAKALNCSPSYLMGWSEDAEGLIEKASADASRQKKIDRLTPEAITELDNYIDYLLSKYSL